MDLSIYIRFERQFLWFVPEYLVLEIEGKLGFVLSSLVLCALKQVKYHDARLRKWRLKSRRAAKLNLPDYVRFVVVSPSKFIYSIL